MAKNSNSLALNKDTKAKKLFSSAVVLLQNIMDFELCQQQNSLELNLNNY